MSGLREYLENMVELHQSMRSGKLPRGYRYLCMEEYILREGRPMEVGVWPKWMKRGRLKECYRNAFNLMLHFGYTYCEGYAVSMIPTMHAWCLDKDGKVIDPTWRDKGKWGRQGKEYYGITFDCAQVVEITTRRRCYGLIDDWQNGWPLLKGKK